MIWDRFLFLFIKLCHPWCKKIVVWKFSNKSFTISELFTFMSHLFVLPLVRNSTDKKVTAFEAMFKLVHKLKLCVLVNSQLTHVGYHARQHYILLVLLFSNEWHKIWLTQKDESANHPSVFTPLIVYCAQKRTSVFILAGLLIYVFLSYLIRWTWNASTTPRQR